MAFSSEQIKKRFDKAVGRKTNWNTTYEEVMEYLAPHRETFDEHTKGEAKRGNGQVYDSTAGSAHEKFASSLQSTMVPPFQQWIDLEPGPEIPPENRQEAKVALQKITETMFSAISHSNFDVQVVESFLDLAVGSSAIHVAANKARNGLVFTSIPISQVYFEEGVNGAVGGVFRKHKVPGRVLQQTWPDIKIPEEMAEQIEENPDKDFLVVEAILETRVTVPVVEEGKVTRVEVDGYQYSVVTENGQHTLVERYSESSPMVPFRYSVVPGEIYGRGPAMRAYHDIRTLNKTKELVLKNASFAVAGAYTVADDGVINISNIKIKPGAIIPVSSNQGAVTGPTIAPLPQAGDFDVGQLVMQDMKQSINDMLLADPLGPIDMPVKSATEISIRQQELAKRIGSAFGRLQFEFIGPLVNRILFVLDEIGMIDLSGFKVDGKIINIAHTSPLAKAQREQDFMNMMRFLETITQAYGQQAAFLITNPLKFIERAAEKIGVDPDILNSQDQIQQIQQGVALAMQQQGAPQGGQ